MNSAIRNQTDQVNGLVISLCIRKSIQKNFVFIQLLFLDRFVNANQILIDDTASAKDGGSVGCVSAGQLVPQRLGSLQNLATLERATGVGGEIDLLLSGRDLARPSTIEWMSSYQSAVLKHFGYSSSRGCGRARLCPAFSLPDLFSGQAPGVAPGSATGAGKLTDPQVRGLLAAIPPYFSQDVISADHHVGTLAFGIRLMGLPEQQRLIDEMRSRLHPPRGVSAHLVGLPVLAASSGAKVASASRRVLTLVVGLLAVALVLLVAFRGDRRRALVPLVPIALASGWSALVLFAVRVPLNPMSVTLGALVKPIVPVIWAARARGLATSATTVRATSTIIFSFFIFSMECGHNSNSDAKQWPLDPTRSLPIDYQNMPLTMAEMFRQLFRRIEQSQNPPHL